MIIGDSAYEGHELREKQKRLEKIALPDDGERPGAESSARVASGGRLLY